MKNILFEISLLSRIVFVTGFLAAVLIIAASAVLYFGAGRWWDYYFCIPVCEKLLAFSRPVGAGTCISALLIEYKAKSRNKI